jgi:hypothetical protein
MLVTPGISGYPGIWFDTCIGCIPFEVGYDGFM